MTKGIEDEGEFLRIDEIRAKGKSPVGETRLDIILGHGKKGNPTGFGHFRYQIKTSSGLDWRLHLNKLPLGSFRELNQKELICSYPANFSTLRIWEI